MSDKLEITLGNGQNDVPVLRLRGRIEAPGAQQLRERCTELHESGCSHLVLDLDGVTFVSSSGLGTFLLLTEEFRSAGGKLVLAAPRSGVTQVLELLNLDQFLEISPSIEGALAETVR
jgi:anti-anti-sigma factor